MLTKTTQTNTMTRRFIYSNKRFWSLIITCVGLFTISLAYQLFVMYQFDQFRRLELEQSTKTLFHTYVLSFIQPTAELIMEVTKNENIPIVPTLDLLRKRGTILEYARYRSDTGHIMTIPRNVDYRGCYSLKIKPSQICETSQGLSYKYHFTQGSDTWELYLPIRKEHIQRLEDSFAVRVLLQTTNKRYYSGIPPKFFQYRNALLDGKYTIQFENWDFEIVWVDGQPLYQVVVEFEYGEYYLLVYQDCSYLIRQGVSVVGFHLLFVLIMFTFFRLFHVNYKFLSYTYRNLIDSMNDGLWYKDTVGRYQIVNKALAQTLYGTHPVTMIGRTDAELELSGEFATLCETSDHKVLTTKLPFRNIERGYVREVELVLDVMKTPFIDEDGILRGVIGCSRDISSEVILESSVKELRTDLQSAQWTLKALFDIIPEYLYIKDTEHKFLRVSKSVAEGHGITMEYVIGRTDFDFFEPEVAQEFWDVEESLFSGKLVIYQKKENIPLVQGIKTILTTKVPLKSNDGTIIGIVGLGTEITELNNNCVEMENALRLLTQVFKQASKKSGKSEPISTGEENHAD